MKKIRTQKNNENPFWLSVGDLMSVLMLLFVFFTAAALVQLSENTIQSKIFALLKNELEQVNIKVEINPEHGTISIADKILFNSNESILKPEGENFLNQFIPKLVKVLFFNNEITNEIVSVDIEGYASQNIMDPEFRYRMMDLSLNRSESVWKHINYSTLDYHQEFLRKLKVCGWGNMMAESPVDDEKDRKVIFQLQFKGQLEKLKEKLISFSG